MTRREPPHVTLPRVQNNERVLIGAREKYKVTYKGKPFRTIADFLAKTLMDGRA
jgi:hypothetical protein